MVRDTETTIADVLPSGLPEMPEQVCRTVRFRENHPQGLEKKKPPRKQGFPNG